MAKKRMIALFLFLILIISVIVIFFYIRRPEIIEEEEFENMSAHIESKIEIGEMFLYKDDSSCRTKEDIEQNMELCGELLMKLAFFFKDRSYCERLDSNRDVQNLCFSLLDENSRQCTDMREDFLEFCNVVKNVYFGEEVNIKSFNNTDRINYAYIIVATLKKDKSYCRKITLTNEARYFKDIIDCLIFSDAVDTANFNVSYYVNMIYEAEMENQSLNFSIVEQFLE